MNAPLPPLLLRGDCLVELARIPDESVDAVVTDPPYNLTARKKGGTGTASINLDSPYGRSRIGTGNGGGGFMGKGWDDYDAFGTPEGGGFQHWCELWSRECLRILKPGGHLLAFGGSRTWHRLAAGIEDAGFEIRDSIAWLYGSGFPKSMDVSKAIDKAAGAVREVVGQAANGASGLDKFNLVQGKRSKDYSEGRATYDVTASATDAAREWEGWGTALKPAFEPVVVARKPLGEKTVAANVLAHGTGALNIDATRIGEEVRVNAPASSLGNGVNMEGGKAHGEYVQPSGRWPANVALDESQAAALDEQSGPVGSNSTVPGAAGSGMFGHRTGGATHDTRASGGASRFFYVAKAPKSERPVYWRPSCNCETIKPCAEPSHQRATDESRSTDDKSWSTSTSGKSRKGGKSHRATTSTTETATSSTTSGGTFNSSRSSSTSESIQAAKSGAANGGSPAESAANSSPSPSSIGTSRPKGGPSTVAADPAILSEWSETSVCANCGAPSRRESHATVKPLSLMRWLCRLVTPPGGIVVDPFAGSGTTLEAAYLEGFESIGVEMTPEYWTLIAARIERVTK